MPLSPDWVTLLAYDVLINLAREKRLVWDETFRPSSVLYYLTRYPVVAYQIFNVVYTPTTPQFTWFISLVLTRFAICGASTPKSQSLIVLIQRRSCAASFILRVYAVMPHNLLGLLLAVSLALIGVLIIALDIWQDVEASCTQASNPLYVDPTVLTFLSLICFDVLTTAVLTWRMARMIDFGGGLKSLNSQKITKLFVQSAELVHSTITGLQLGGVILYFGVYSTVLNNYTLLLSSILVSHFLLNLRELVYDGDADVTTSAMQSMSFAPSPSRSDHAKGARTLMEEFGVPSYSYFSGSADSREDVEMRRSGAYDWRLGGGRRDVVPTAV
ncbi:hypothetical protein K466DRAFT_587350 [Polyporus arcularius HHB13444]|uniref:DUF6533 domain-containing protein n=1 Tax=Polyporus arcularius HHB13444 TaxID=1314778 RepID=A0A5C3PBF2_9APHY|nr:hypothetical protein K466DRAFT_587350 [Polyporus arcularius HHB13444]